jgi:hypothetical protein
MNLAAVLIPPALDASFIVFLFGIFRLSVREFAVVTLYTLAAYALVINLLMHPRPRTGTRARRRFVCPTVQTAAAIERMLPASVETRPFPDQAGATEARRQHGRDVFPRSSREFCRVICLHIPGFGKRKQHEIHPVSPRGSAVQSPDRHHRSR